MKKLLFIPVLFMIAVSCYKSETYGNFKFKSDKMVADVKIYSEHNTEDPLLVKTNVVNITEKLNEGNYILVCDYTQKVAFQMRPGKNTRVRFLNNVLEADLPE